MLVFCIDVKILSDGWHPVSITIYTNIFIKSTENGSIRTKFELQGKFWIMI